jgi:hypothetical protein
VYHFILVKEGEVCHTTSEKKRAVLEKQGWKYVIHLKAWNASFGEVHAPNS